MARWRTEKSNRQQFRRAAYQRLAGSVAFGLPVSHSAASQVTFAYAGRALDVTYDGSRRPAFAGSFGAAGARPTEMVTGVSVRASPTTKELFKTFNSLHLQL